ncbi:hypothetical protein BKA63DRAFT_526869 [Paraphoma chrysanthemicola]|nr:hypothetical protein BKA63DRAFT_526869 [Paraphoma chrysanthemicola]
MIRKRLDRAETQFYRRPPFYSDYSLVRPRMTIANDTLPKYQAGCVCSMHHALSSAAQHMVVPFWFWKTTLPTTTDELAQYCPCSLAKAYDRLVRGLNSLPPAVEMYYGQAPLYVLLWKQPQASLKPQDQEKAIASQWLNDTRRVVQGRPKYLMFVSDDGDSINVPVRSAKQEKTRFLEGKNGVVYRRLYVDKEERAKVEAEAEAEENDEDEWNM